MNELIKLNETKINDELVQTVSARELHTFLEVGKDFSTWIKNRLETLGSIENEDYLVVQEVFPKTGEKGGRPKTEYYLTIDVAKHLAMMERNERGLQVRNYFIECEKKLHEVTQPQPAQPIGEVEDKLRAIAFALDRSSLSDVAKETYIITSAETLTGVCIGYRPKRVCRTTF